VVLENIYRHRQLGEPAPVAALKGTQEVWGAVLASTLTTVAVFLPVTFVHDELGQLLADIAIAVSCAVALSLLIAVTVVPSLAAKVLNKAETPPPATNKATGLSERIIAMVKWINLSVVRKMVVVAGCLVGAIGLGWILMPDTEYLPRSKTDWVDAYLSPPPGYSIEELTHINEIFAAELSELTLGSDEDNAQAPGGGIGDYSFVMYRGLVSFGLSSRTLTGAGEFIPVIDRLAAMIPGTIHFAEQWNIFAGVGSETANIDLEILGPDLKEQVALAAAVLGRVYEVIPDSQAYPLPSLDLGNPELQFSLIAAVPANWVFPTASSVFRSVRWWTVPRPAPSATRVTKSTSCSSPSRALAIAPMNWNKCPLQHPTANGLLWAVSLHYLCRKARHRSTTRSSNARSLSVCLRPPICPPRQSCVCSKQRYWSPCAPVVRSVRPIVLTWQAALTAWPRPPRPSEAHLYWPC
jgi:hypothetical protein